MSPIYSAVLFFVLMIILMLVRMRIAFVFAFLGFIGFWYLGSLKGALGVLNNVPFTEATHYSMITIPMFVLMGELIYHSGISRELFDSANKWLGHLPGGMAIAVIATCGAFAAVSGSSVATAATMCEVALPEMESRNYSQKFAAGSIAAGGTLGVLIPPSTVMIVYGILSEESIGKLLIAGLIPGIILMCLYALTAFLQAKINPSLAPPTVKAPLRERFASLKGVWATLALFLLVIGGLYAGIFTPVEAASVGSFGALTLMILRHRFTWKAFGDSCSATTRITAMIMTIIIGAMVFNRFLALTGLPPTLSKLAAGAGSPYVVLAAIIGMYIILGCIMDAAAMTILTVPIIYPVIIAAGFDGIWFGVIFVMICEMAMITPPIGMNCFVIAGAASHIPLMDIFRGVAPFLSALIAAIILMILFPQLGLFLPSMMAR